MKNLLSLSISILLINISFSQQHSEPLEIKYNFKSKTLKLDSNKIKSMAKGDFFKVKIDNINLNIYGVSLEKNDSTLFKEFNTSNLFNSYTNLSSLVDGIISSVISIPKNEIDSNNKKKIQKPSELTGISNFYSVKLLSFGFLIKNIASDIDSLAIKTNMDIKRSKVLYSIEKNDPNKKIDIKYIDKYHAKIIEFKDSLESIGKGISSISNKLIKIKDSLSKIDSSKYIKTVNDFNTLSTAVSKLQVNLSSENVNKTLNTLYDIINNSSGKYETLPIQMTDDFTTLNLKITPLDSGSRLPSYNTKIAFPLQRDFYFSVGTGVYHAGLNDSVYSVIGQNENDSVNSYRLINERSNNFELGANIMLQGGYIFCRKNNINIGVHASLGTGFSFTQNVRTRFLYGGGLTIGNKHNLAINIGGISGYVDRLSNAFNLDSKYSEIPEKTNVSLIQHKLFGSVGYCFIF
ncbi:MAG: hypothetical protein N4A35_16240 [Flavobacteriales bacterium]|jgi:hypothetical protein|nr:hypothetical protein [Flavobacteriales bacterium]